MGTPNILPYSNGQFETKIEFDVASDYALALAVFNGGVYLAWVNDNTIGILPPNGDRNTPGGDTYVGPALAVFNDQLFMASTGTNQQLNIWLSTDGVFYNPTSLDNWSYVTPSLAGFNNQLYMAFTGTDGQLNIWSSSDGVTFGNQQKLGNMSNAGPSLAVFNTQLYMAFTGTDSQLYIWSSADGQNFGSSPQALDNKSNVAPILAASTDGSVLNMAFTGTDGRPNIWSSTDGTTWDNGTKQISQNATLNSPALVAFEDKMYLGFTGEDGSGSESILAAFEAFMSSAAPQVATILADVFVLNWNSAISAMSALLSSSAFAPVLQAVSGAGMNTIGLVGGDEGGVIVGAGGLAGLLTGTASGNQSKFYSYGDVGISIGTTEGDALTLGLYASTEKPEDIGGLEFFTEVSGTFGVGAALVAFVTIFGGAGLIASVTTGEEEEASVGAGWAISHPVPPS